MSKNFLDKSIEFISPKWGKQRAEQRVTIQAIDYFGLNYSRNRGTIKASNADDDNEFSNMDRENCRNEARDAYRRNAIARAVCDRISNLSVNDGLLPLAKTSDKEWNKVAENYFENVWSKQCDYFERPNYTLWDFQKLIPILMLIDGDMLFVKMDNGKIAAYEAELIGTPNEYEKDVNVLHGVRKDKAGKFLGMYILPRANGKPDKAGKYVYYRKEEIFYIGKPQRFSGMRPLPMLSSCLAKLKDIKETDESIRAVLKAQSKIFAVHKMSEEDISQMIQKNVNSSSYINKKDVEQIDVLTKFNIGHGDEMTGFSSTTPSGSYLGFLEDQIKEIGAALGISHTLLMLNFEKGGSYNSQRMSALHSEKTIMYFYDTVMEFSKWAWNHAILFGIINKDIPPAPVDEKGISEYYKVEFATPDFVSVDREKDANTDAKFLSMGLESHVEILKRKGKNIENLLEDEKQVLILAQKKADEANEELGRPLFTYQHFINKNVVGGAPMESAPEEPQETEEQDKEDE